MKVLHVITSLATGGAQTVLYRVLGALADAATEHSVVCLGAGHPLAEKIRALGVQVWVLDGRGRREGPQVMQKTRSIARDYRPDVILGWQYDGNLAAYWAARGCDAALVWNVRHSVADLRQEPPGTRLAIRLNAWLSHAPKIVLCNSETAVRQHIALGFPADAMRFIPNGYDTGRLSPGKEDRARVRQELGVPEDAFVIGKVARFHPMKDHLNLVAAAQQLLARIPRLQVLLAGRGVVGENRTLTEAISRYGLDDRVQLLGERSDIPALNAAFDIAVSASAWGEGFSNAIAEAMACGTPIVATDVGDAAMIVGECGRIVPPGSPHELAKGILAIERLSATERQAVGQQGRGRIREKFGLEQVAETYRQILLAVNEERRD